MYGLATISARSLPIPGTPLPMVFTVFHNLSDKLWNPPTPAEALRSCAKINEFITSILSSINFIILIVCQVCALIFILSYTEFK